MMNYLSRLGTLTLVAWSGLSSKPLCAVEVQLHPAANSTELLLAHSAQGYLGVGLNDVDNDRASALKLKDTHGAEIITVDQDAPAAKAGLKAHDVVVQMNGQRIEGVEQFRRMIRETPPGRTVVLVAVRDGQNITLNVQLADRAAVAALPDDDPRILVSPSVDPPLETWVLPSSGLHSGQNSLLGSLTRDRYYVGVELQPLPTGLAEYFGVRGGSGMLVGNVFPNSPAAVAGLKAADIIQKVNGQPIVSLNDWERAIRANHGKQIKVTLIRDKKEQTLTMVAGTAKTSGLIEIPSKADADAVAQLGGDLASIDAAALAEEMKRATANLDIATIEADAERAGRSIDMTEVQKALDLARQHIQEDQQQMRQRAQELTRELQSLRLEQMD
jgi:serine protease Do